jgi:3-oxoacyl-[acyl-carrier protein] reductase
MDLGLKDRVYVITGATRGLGFAAAEQLIADGAKVVVSGRTDEAATEAAAQLDAGSAVGIGADNASPETAARLIETAKSRFGRFDGVLISVGGPPAGVPADALTDEQWQSAFETVFLGAVRLARTAVGELGEDGVIAFVLSGSVHEPIPGLTLSNGLRPGLAGFAKSLANEAGPRGVRVLGLLPGRIATERMGYLDSLGGDAQATRTRNEATIPLRRYGTPEEFGRTAAFVLSPAASYLTGVMLPVDGGARHGF